MERINELQNSLAKIIDNCLDNLDEDDLLEIKNRMASLIEQEAFWVMKENEERYCYELKKFLTWLCDYVLVKDNEFWKE